MKYSDNMIHDSKTDPKEQALCLTLPELREKIQTLEDGTILTVVFKDEDR